MKKPPKKLIIAMLTEVLCEFYDRAIFLENRDCHEDKTIDENCLQFEDHGSCRHSRARNVLKLIGAIK